MPASAFRMARHTEGLPQLSTGLSCLPALPKSPATQLLQWETSRCRQPVFFTSTIDLVGPVPTSVGYYTYCLTAVDRFRRWPEAIPIPESTADTMVRTLLTGWIFRFGCPETITIDQGRQFELQLFHLLARLCGIQLSRTSAHHPAANGLVESFHRTLKAAIMCHADQQWTEALPLLLLGIRTSFKADLQATVAELVYGEPLTILGELLTPTVEPVHLITQLRQHMARLRPGPP
jgi:cleavage and polyadenylation specificity factor subunit 1